MRPSSIRILSVIAALVVAVPLFAQAPKKGTEAATPAPTNTTPSVKKPDLPVPPPNFEYSSEGRRDPFISLVNKGDEGTTGTKGAPALHLEGVPGILTQELTVKGILQTRGTWVAMVSGPDKKVYTVRAGDKLADGLIRSVNATSLVVLQEVHDPLSLEKQREVRKFLRGGEEVK